MARKSTKTARRAKTPDEPRRLAIDAARLAEDRRCENILVLDVRGSSPVTDYFVIATGTSDRQMRSAADDIARMGKATGNPVWNVAGLESADWIVLDFVNVVVHLFDEAHRRYYDLELLWGDAPKLRWRRRKTTAQAEEAADEEA